MMIDFEWLFDEIDRRVSLNEEEGTRLNLGGLFESATFYFGCADSLRELKQDLAVKFQP